MRTRRVDPNDPAVFFYRGVSEPALLTEHNLFIAEGRAVVRRVLRDRRFHVRSALMSETACEALADDLERLPEEAPILIADLHDFQSMTGFHIHRGCLALVERPPDLTIGNALAGQRTIVVLDAVGDADNVGSVFRNAAAFGAGVVLSPTCGDPWYRKAVRTSMGSVLRVPFARAAEWPAALDHIRAEGFRIVAMTPREPAEPLRAFASRQRAGRLAIVIGTEGAGLSAEVEAMADARVKIEMEPGVDSLNSSVAAGIALYALAGQAGRG
jgi:tRNA G18 (ribose-2'-O)-methylase SpoU